VRPCYRTLASLTGLGLLILDVRNEGLLARADQRILESVARLPRPPAMVRAARIVTSLGDPKVARLLGPGLAALAAAGPDGTARPDGTVRPDGPPGAASSVCAAIRTTADIVIGASACKVASAVIARPRPPEWYWLANPVGHSFPSRHTTYATLALGAGTRGYPRPARQAAAALCLAVGVSRVYLGVHWSTDVAAGWLLAASCLSAAEVLENARASSSSSAGQ
jgi:membrane-associated phospholipid phosphatase